jgi:simple sugar transport system ATP-binding protein
MTGIDKRWGAVHALNAVDLEVASGSFHAIVGENGAGKTTLMRVLYGSLAPDAGEIAIDGQPQTIRNSAEAIRLGIGMVSQHYGIIPELTCLQNLMMGSEPGWLLSPKASTERAEQLANKMGFRFDWHQEASELSPAGNQKLEILKLLWRRARILILDEPTAMLSPRDADQLFGSLRELVTEGATVLLVTHRLPEVMEHCQQVTVLRQGVRVASVPVAETSDSALANLIVGGNLTDLPPKKPVENKPLLEIRDLSVIGSRGEQAVKQVTFNIRAGEILGIAGVDGSGQRELIHAILGLRSAQSGSISVEGKNWIGRSTRSRLLSGLRTIPEDRHREAILESWSLTENAALGSQFDAPFRTGTQLDRAACKTQADQMAKRFQTRFGRLEDPIRSLSGGNQQRFVAARALREGVRVLVAFQPARGLDLNATRNVYAGMRAAAEQGAAILVVSFDLDELLQFCDRIVVMNRGSMHEPAANNPFDREAIGRLMVGAG